MSQTLPHVEEHLRVEYAESAEGHRVDEDEVHPRDVHADVRGVHPHGCIAEREGERSITHFIIL